MDAISSRGGGGGGGGGGTIFIWNSSYTVAALHAFFHIHCTCRPLMKSQKYSHNTCIKDSIPSQVATGQLVIKYYPKYTYLNERDLIVSTVGIETQRGIKGVEFKQVSSSLSTHRRLFFGQKWPPAKHSKETKENRTDMDRLSTQGVREA